MATGRHLILATVIDVLPGQVTYPACISCYTKLHHLSVSDQFQCQRCGKLYKIGEVSHRYRLAIKVTNQSVCRDVTVFGSCLEPYFGTDATSFARYMDHAALCHQTSNNELHTSVTNALVGHPFYFGFKMSGNIFTQNGHHAASCVPLANIVARESESLVAIQMTSPFQSWNFTTVLQNVLTFAFSLDGQSIREEHHAQCNPGDRHDPCPLEDILQHRCGAGNQENEHNLERIDQSRNRGSHEREVDLTCSRQDRTCNESSRASSILGETFFSSSIPSFRLSCDKSLSTVKQTPHSSRLSSVSTYPESSSNKTTETKELEYSIQSEACRESINQSICTGDDSTAAYENTECESKVVFETVHSTVKPAYCQPSDSTQSEAHGKIRNRPECIVDDSTAQQEIGERESKVVLENVHRASKSSSVLSQSCRTTVPILDLARNIKCEDRNCVMQNYKVAFPQDGRSFSKDTVDICNRTKDESITMNKGIKGHGENSAAINNSSVIQECEEYMNQWLEDNSSDGWSYHETMQNPGTNRKDSSCHDYEAKKLTPACMRRHRSTDKVKELPHSDVSRISSCPDFPDDLPFSEDIDQFLQDVEEAYALSKNTAIASTSRGSEDYLLKTNDTRTSGNHRDSKCKKLVSAIGSSKTDGIVSAGKSGRKGADRGIRFIKRYHSESQSSDGSNLNDRYLSNRSTCIVNSDIGTYSVSDSDEDSACNQTPEQYSKSSNRNLIFQEEGNRLIFTEGEASLCNMSPKQHITSRCGNLLVQEEGNKQTKEQLIKNDNDGNTSRGEQIGKDDHRGFTPLDTSLQNEQSSLMSSRVGEMEEDSPWCEEDFSQSPLLFSQSQSPILVSRSPRFLVFHDRRSTQEDSCLDATNNSVPNQENASPKLRLNLNTSKGKFDRDADIPKDHHTDAENVSREDLQSSDQGTPCLFSQASDDLQKHSQLSVVPPSRNLRVVHSRAKATPLRQLFLQRARSWKMSSTPMTSKKSSTAGRSFNSPVSCGTPDLFSSENSPSGDAFLSSDQQIHSKTSSSFEYTPDLF